MRKIFYKKKFLYFTMILLCIHSKMLAQVTDKKINACMKLLSSDNVSQSVVKHATFHKNNIFEIGETVIVKGLFGCWYGCVTDIVSASPLAVKLYSAKFTLYVKTKRYESTATYFNDNVGKLGAPLSLVDLSIEEIVKQLKSGKLKERNILPPQLPQELYDKIREAETRMPRK